MSPSRSALRDHHRRPRDVLGRLRHRRDPRRGVRGARRAARRAPLHRSDRRAGGLPLPHARGAARPHDRRRPGARAGLRSARRPGGRSSWACRRRSSGSSTRTPACAASSTRSARRARASCSCSAATSTRPRRSPGGSSTASPRAAELEATALELAGELAGNAPLSQLGNKRVIAALLGAEGELPRGGRGGADRAAPRVLRLAGHARGNAGLRRETPPALARGVASATLRNVNLQQRARGRSHMPPLITREEALQLGEIEDHAADRGAGRARLGSARGALRRLHRHVLAGQRQVRRLRRGLRLLRAVALRRGRDADARDDGARAGARARARRRGRGRAPLLHGHPGPGPVQARLREVPARASAWSPSTPTSSAAPRSGTCPPRARRR